MGSTGHHTLSINRGGSPPTLSMKIAGAVFDIAVKKWISLTLLIFLGQRNGLSCLENPFNLDFLGKHPGLGKEAESIVI